MLINNLKKILFFARSTKRSNISLNRKEDASKSQLQTHSFSHHMSPTLQKLQKQYNDSIKKQQLQQDELMKGFEELVRANGQQKDQKKKSKTNDQIQKQLKSLEVPIQLQDKFFKKNLRNNSQKQDLFYQKKNHENLQEFEDIDLSNIEIRSQTGVKSEQEANQLKKILFKKNDPLAAHKLRQDMLLNYITKQSKEKQAQLNLTEDWKKQIEKNKEQKRSQEMIANQRLRYEKLREQMAGSNQKAIQKRLNQNNYPMRNDPNDKFSKLEKLKSPQKIQVSQDDVWRSNYSPQLIEQAMNYKNKQLEYFKDLIQGDKRPQWDYKRQKGLMKPPKQHKDIKKNYKEIVEKAKLLANTDFGTETVLNQEQGLTKYQNLEYYQEKGLKQFKEAEKKSQYDKNLQSQGLKDLIEGNRLSDIFIDNFLDPSEGLLQKRQKYESSSFGKFENKLKQISKKITKLGIDHQFQDLTVLNKQQLFAEKKIREQNESYHQYLLKKQKKKKMKEQLKKIHRQKLRQDLNYDIEMDPVRLQKLNPIEMEEGIKQIEELKKQKQSMIVSEQYLKEKIHHTKTLKNMTSYVNAFFYNRLENQNSTINDRIQIGNIIANRKNTVLNVFWKWKPVYEKQMKILNFTEQQQKREKQILAKKLQKQSKFISSKMTEFFGLRYGPDIRFYFDQILQQTKQAAEQMRKYKHEIVELSVQEYKEKGFINTPQKQQQYRKKLLHLAESNLKDLNNQKKLINKKFLKMEKQRKKIENRKRQKELKKNNSQSQENVKNLKKKLSDKQKDEKLLNEIIGEKIQKKKQKIFTSMPEDQFNLYFGEGDKNKSDDGLQNNPKRTKIRGPEKMWEEINKL